MILASLNARHHVSTRYQGDATRAVRAAVPAKEGVAWTKGEISYLGCLCSVDYLLTGSAQKVVSPCLTARESFPSPNFFPAFHPSAL